jgi:hypothetical protein
MLKLLDELVLHLAALAHAMIYAYHDLLPPGALVSAAFYTVIFDIHMKIIHQALSNFYSIQKE